jgi:3-mercaptopyruvate sulfurtransferase SseA
MSCGKWQPTTTAHSNPERNSKRFIRKISAIRRTATQSFTAGGERASHTWFVLTKLLGFEKVRNYDGSWTEWGNMVRTPVEKG